MEVILNEGIQKIGDFAFSDCTLLQSITLPSSVTEVSNAAFFDCNNLREAILNEGLKKIGHGAFCFSTSFYKVLQFLPQSLRLAIMHLIGAVV